MAVGVGVGVSGDADADADADEAFSVCWMFCMGAIVYIAGVDEGKRDDGWRELDDEFG